MFTAGLLLPRLDLFPIRMEKKLLHLICIVILCPYFCFNYFDYKEHTANRKEISENIRFMLDKHQVPQYRDGRSLSARYRQDHNKVG